MRRMREPLREPVVHFLVIGAVIFGLFGLTKDPVDTQAKRVVVSEGDVERLAAQFARTWIRPPTQAKLDGLIDGFVREEVYYREALALGLDRDDPIVRQRMRQKLEFLLEDLAGVVEPDDAELEGFLTEHAERFALPPRISFKQVYLNPDRHADLDAATRALRQELDAGGNAELLGDRIMLGHLYESATPKEIARLFGEAFAQDVAALELGTWHGPIDSGLGRHFVQVLDRQPGRMPPLDAVRDRVAAEWLAQRRQVQKDAAYARLREGYEVIIEPVGVPEPAASEASVTDS
jgi:hypothetical protein